MALADLRPQLRDPPHRRGRVVGGASADRCRIPRQAHRLDLRSVSGGGRGRPHGPHPSRRKQVEYPRADPTTGAARRRTRHRGRRHGREHQCRAAVGGGLQGRHHPRAGQMAHDAAGRLYLDPADRLLRRARYLCQRAGLPAGRLLAGASAEVRRQPVRARASAKFQELVFLGADAEFPRSRGRRATRRAHRDGAERRSAHQDRRRGSRRAPTAASSSCTSG